MTKAGNRVAKTVRFTRFRVLNCVVAVHLISFAEIVVNVCRPLIDVDWCAGRTNKARRAPNLNKIGSWNQGNQFCDYEVGGGGALSVAEHQTVEIQSLSLA